MMDRSDIDLDDRKVIQVLREQERVIVEGIQKARPGSTVNASEQPASTEPSPTKKGE